MKHTIRRYSSCHCFESFPRKIRSRCFAVYAAVVVCYTRAYSCPRFAFGPMILTFETKNSKSVGESKTLHSGACNTYARFIIIGRLCAAREHIGKRRPTFAPPRRIVPTLYFKGNVFRVTRTNYFIRVKKRKIKLFLTCAYSFEHGARLGIYLRGEHTTS